MYHIGPSFHPHETEMGYNVIDAAVAESKKPGSKFKHFVYSSVLNSQLSKMLNHDRKKYVEEYLMESGLKYTILQPGHFMDPWVKMLAAQVKEQNPVHHAMWDPDVSFSFLALRDMGAISTKVIMEREKHFCAQYPLVSTGPIPYTEFVKTVGKEMGKEIRIEKVEYQEAVDKMCETIFKTKDVEQRYRDAPERMLLFYNKRGLIGSPNVCEWLLEMPPTSIKQLTQIQLSINASSENESKQTRVNGHQESETTNNKSESAANRNQGVAGRRGGDTSGAAARYGQLQPQNGQAIPNAAQGISGPVRGDVNGGHQGPGVNQHQTDGNKSSSAESGNQGVVGTVGPDATTGADRNLPVSR